MWIRQHPTVLLNIPVIGFIPYMLLFDKNMYFDFTAWQKDELRTWIRDNDVIVAAGAKTGTTMLLYISHLIRVRGDIDSYPFREVNVATPWPSIMHSPGQTWEQMKVLMNSTVLNDGKLLKQYWDHPQYPFRIFKSHETPVIYEHNDGAYEDLHIETNVLDVRAFPKVKFVAMTRDLPDALASFYPFPANHDDEFVNIWGGFPPAFLSVDHLLHTFLHMNKLSKLHHVFCGYTLSWWKVHQDPNVLFLHYNEAINDRRAFIIKLANFYNQELTDEEVTRIYDLSSIEAMRKIGYQFNYQLWGNKNFRNGTGTCMKSGKLLRKGIVGDSKIIFTESQLRVLRDFEDKFYGKSEDGVAAKTFSRQGT